VEDKEPREKVIEYLFREPHLSGGEKETHNLKGEENGSDWHLAQRGPFFGRKMWAVGTA